MLALAVNNRWHRLCTLFCGFLWGLLVVLLYSIYMLSFLGQRYNARVFTFNIFYGYLKSLTAFVQFSHIGVMWLFLVIAVVPVSVLAIYLRYARRISGLFISLHRPRSSHKNTIAVALLVTAVLCITLRVKYDRQFLRGGDLFSAVCLQSFQGEFLSNKIESHLVRDNYPKNIVFERKNVILIVVDALRADHLGVYGYKRNTSPFIDSMVAAKAFKKVNIMLSSAGASFPCVLSMLRSKSWHNMSDRNFSLPELLHDQGYRLNFLVSGDHTHFYGLKSYYSDTFNYYIDGYTTRQYTVNDDRIIFEGLQATQPYNGPPGYFHLHLNSVHRAGLKLKENKQFMPDDPLNNVECYINNYDNGVVQADANIRRIFDELQVKGYLSNSIVMITADHGESMGENGIFGHSRNVYASHTVVPLLIYDPENYAYKNLDVATQTDIAPTIVDRLGLPVPPTWEGFSLLKDRPETYTYQEMLKYYAVVHSKGQLLLKYIYNESTNTEELYNLRTDLYEHHNIIDSIARQSPAEINILRQKIKSVVVKN